MPSLLDLRRRIRSIRSTQKITRAMKMVAAARLRRAQERVIAARPYSSILKELLENVAGAALRDEKLERHPLLAQRPENRVQLVLLTSDRGLAGAFNTNLVRAAQRFMDERAAGSVQIEAVGRKGRDYFRRREAAITGEHLGVYQKALYSDAAAIARTTIDRYRNEEIDAVYLLYNEFKSVVSQKLTIRRVLPISVPAEAGQTDYIYDVPLATMLESLLPRYVEVGVYQAIVESAAAEHAARMTAMDAATTNAAEVIEKLTLFMNRVRQASITREIIEVVSGAAALE